MKLDKKRNGLKKKTTFSIAMSFILTLPKTSTQIYITERLSLIYFLLSKSYIQLTLMVNQEYNENKLNEANYGKK